MQSKASVLLTAAVAAAVTVCLVLYPDLAFQAALRGLRIWWFVVFPALLPFFIAGQVLMGLGAVHFLGALLERWMRPLFNVPGVGAFVVAMGLASGYPIGAVLTARLHRDGQVTTAEAERLIGFCNTADPLFMAGAVAVGMFGDARLAGSIMACHYLAALGTGLVLRFHRAGERGGEALAERRGPLLPAAVEALVQARARDGRPLGQLLGEAVRDSVQTLMLVGGFIILFAVVIDVLAKVGLVALASGAIAWVLHPLGVTRSAAAALIGGLFEITIGTKAASQAAVPLRTRLMLCNAIIAWSGLSVFAQVAAVSQGTGISLKPYVLARVVQATLAAALTFWFWNPQWAVHPGAGGVVAATAGVFSGAVPLVPNVAWGGMLKWSALLLAAVLAAAAAGTVACAVRGRAAVLWSLRGRQR